MTPLVESVFSNDLARVQSLLEAGANPNERDQDGRTALIHAVLGNRPEAARTLLESRADPNVQDNLGNSALHYAAQDYNPDIADLLLDNKAQVDIEDRHGNTPLWRAVFNSRGRGEVIALLLRRGADESHRNKHGKTPADLAKSIANYNVAQFLR